MTAKAQRAQPWDKYSVTVETVVRWRDLDAYNHVNNSVYLNYFEEGRMAYYYRIAELAGVSPENKEIFDGFATVLAKTDVEFKGQGRLHETLVIGIRYTAIRKIFLDAEYGIFNKSDGQLLARGHSTQVSVEKEAMRPMRVHPDFIRYAQQIEGDALTVVA
ncbi:MAG: acyl-CoA thioesterase [Leptospiraceae bacterium]|nr:acyl-CoA thioesterase [Leptospiraceae bacterium]HMY12213.1 thioesterase family protein [Turneriella sp.]